MQQGFDVRSENSVDVRLRVLTGLLRRRLVVVVPENDAADVQRLRLADRILQVDLKARRVYLSKFTTRAGTIHVVDSFAEENMQCDCHVCDCCLPA